MRTQIYYKRFFGHDHKTVAVPPALLDLFDGKLSVEQKIEKNKAVINPNRAKSTLTQGLRTRHLSLRSFPEHYYQKIYRLNLKNSFLICQSC
jgi:hypothetical protein